MIISILVPLILLGFGLWLVSLIPMDARIKQIITGVAILLVILWLLQAFGVFGGEHFGGWGYRR
jgi:predicted small integral membrane protein